MSSETSEKSETPCPSDECWEVLDGKCVIKTERPDCHLLLHCDPEIMDFRFEHSKLFGTDTSEEISNDDCPVKNSLRDLIIGDKVTPLHPNIDKMWRYSKGLILNIQLTPIV